MDSCSSCLASAKRCHLVPSSPTDPNLRRCPHAPASPVRAHSCVISLWVCECQHWVGIRHQRNQNVTKRCKTSIQRASLTAPLQYCMWYHSFLCVRKCVECRLWKELEALQHQKSVGMHQIGRTRLLATAHLMFDKNQRSLGNRVFRNYAKIKWVYVVMCLFTWCSKGPKGIVNGLKRLCSIFRGNVLNKNYFSNDAQVLH